MYVNQYPLDYREILRFEKTALQNKIDLGQSLTEEEYLKAKSLNLGRTIKKTFEQWELSKTDK